MSLNKNIFKGLNVTAPDTNRQEMFRHRRGLWMLYMDFKTYNQEMQMIHTINHPGCEMVLQIVSGFTNFIFKEIIKMGFR